MKGLRPDYKETSKVKFRLVGRERYPTKTYSTSTVSDNVTVKYLPSASCYYQNKRCIDRRCNGTLWVWFLFIKR